jgi:hypothetical protein
MRQRAVELARNGVRETEDRGQDGEECRRNVPLHKGARQREVASGRLKTGGREVMSAEATCVDTREGQRAGELARSGVREAEDPGMSRNERQG